MNVMRSTASSANLPAVKGADASLLGPPPPRNRGRSDLARRFSAFLAVALVAIGVALVYETPPASAAEVRAGDLDPTFGDDGKVTTDFGDDINRVYNRAHAMALQPDGKIVAVGYAGNDFAVARYNANGSLDTSFGTGGKVRTDIGGGEDKAHALALQSDGKIVVAGEAVVSGDTEFAVARYNADGTLDTGFSSDGKATVGSATPTEPGRWRSTTAARSSWLATPSTSSLLLATTPMARWTPASAATAN